MMPASLLPSLVRAAALALGLLLPGLPASAREAPAEVADVIAATLPAVVNIVAWNRVPNGSKTSRWKRFFGSGFIIDADGLIVTNKHVTDGAEVLQVTFADRTQAVATVVADGGSVDLALLKVQVNRQLAVVKFGDSDRLRIGDPVLTIGNPLGVGTSVSAGIISALDRDIKDSPYDDFIQTDAAINHGNSGGPLINPAGEVVGVDTALYSDVSNGGSIGLGFAITSNDTQFVIDRLRRYGEVRAGWIGVQLQDVTAEIANGLGLSQPEGAVVARVDKGEPAERAGVRVGDVITAINGTSFGDGRHEMRAIGKAQIGQQLRLAVLRDGARLDVPVIVGSYPGDRSTGKPAAAAATIAAIAEKPDFGIKLGMIGPAMRARFGLGEISGMVISSVDPDSPAGARGLVPGDVLLQVDDTPIRTPADFEAATKRARQRGRTYAVVLVQKKDGPQWVPLLARPLDFPKP